MTCVSTKIHFTRQKPTIDNPVALEKLVEQHVGESVIYEPSETYSTGRAGILEIYLLAFRGLERSYYVRASVDPDNLEIYALEIC